jgi:predicted nucleic acid-binding protein
VAERCFIDANILIYAVGRPSEYKASCAAVLSAVAAQRLTAVTDAEVVQEIVHHYRRSGRLQDARPAIHNFALVVPEVEPVRLEDALEAVDLLLAGPGLSSRDALHYAVMRRLGVTHIITADRHFADLPGVRCLDPREINW